MYNYNNMTVEESGAEMNDRIKNLEASSEFFK